MVCETFPFDNPRIIRRAESHGTGFERRIARIERALDRRRGAKKRRRLEAKKGRLLAREFVQHPEVGVVAARECGL